MSSPAPAQQSLTEGGAGTALTAQMTRGWSDEPCVLARTVATSSTSPFPADLSSLALKGGKRYFS
eukprot:5744141-Pleurochrysis_carterae.AAC.1